MAAGRRKLAASLAVLTALAITAVAIGPAAAEPTVTAQDVAPGTIHSKLAAGSHTVTLVTGDQVSLTVDGAGRVQITVDTASRADGSTPDIDWYSTGDGVFVIPSDVRPYLDSGQMDEKLFDVEYLAANGYEAEGEMPLIVEYSGSVKPLEATASTVPLKSVDAASVRVKRGHLRDFWAGLVKGKTRSAGPAKTMATASSSVPSWKLPNGVERIWLDRVAKIVLDESVPQVGAPRAWETGFTGSGVKVAILDTGIDATHPDLAGQVVASRSFVDSADQAVDDHGHGTHVASTVAGSGAASGGTHVGVAPDADLIIAKVCDAAGDCRDSDVIAGMEWATIEQDADVVNVSLGGCCTDGTDPLSQAVNTLTAQTGALFVISAGNSGPAVGTIGSPGTADAALTVAAVDKSDKLASFSSRGPRSGDNALKPEISAPGVSIVAARAAGTAMGTVVDEHYTSANGTSMAAPHVAGAAALLAQQHPDWTPAQLKAALVASAQDVGYSVYEQGAGRLDVGRAVSQQVQVSPAVADFGFLVEPQQSGAALTRTLTYTNPTGTPVTLDVAASFGSATGTAPPDGTLTVDHTTLTVPAEGTASVTVSLSHAGLPNGRYTGSVVATNTGTGLRLTSPVGLTIGAQKHPVTITAVSRACENGVACRPGDSSFSFGSVELYLLNSTQSTATTATASTRITLRPTVVPGEVKTFEGMVPAGEYLLKWQSKWQDPVSNLVQSAQYFLPEVNVAGPTELRVDANDLVKTEFKTPRPVGENLAATRVMTRLMADGSVGMNSGSAIAFGLGNMWTNPTPPVSDGTITHSFGGIFTAPQIAMTAAGTTGMELSPILSGYRPEGYPHATTPVRFPEGTHTWDLVDAGLGTADDLAEADVSGRLALITTDYSVCHIPAATLQRLLDAGAVGVVYDPKLCALPAYVLPFALDHPQIPYASIPGAEAERLRGLLDAGPVDITVTSTPQTPYTYYLSAFDHGQLPVSPVFSYGADNLVTNRAVYHSKTDGMLELTHFYWHPDQTMQIGQNYPFTVPGTAIEYWSVAPGAELWRIVEGADLGLAKLSRSDVFDQAEQRIEHWNAGIMVPGAAVEPAVGQIGGIFEPNACSGCRDGDTFWPQVYQTIDDPHYTAGILGLTVPLDITDPWAGMHLYRDGSEIPMTPALGFIPAYQLPPDAGRYQFVLDATATRTPSRTVWDFVSSGTADTHTVGEYRCVLDAVLSVPATACRAEPLIYLRYSGLDLNLRHEARTQGAQRFAVTAYRQPSATPLPPIASLKLWVSYDGGDNWTEAAVKQQRSGQFTVRLVHPPAGHRASDTVTIRAEAWDTDGNRIQQTIRNAYQLANQAAERRSGHLVR